eukprot:13171416-Heterocapsa_arctica.AAC.1
MMRPRGIPNSNRRPSGNAGVCMRHRLPDLRWLPVVPFARRRAWAVEPDIWTRSGCGSLT